MYNYYHHEFTKLIQTIFKSEHLKSGSIMKRLLYFFVSACLLSSCMVSNTPGKYGTGKQNNTSATSKSPSQQLICKSRFLNNGNSVRVYLSIDTDKQTNVTQFIKDLSISFSLYPDYTSRQVISSTALMLTPENVTLDGNWFTVSFDLPKPKDMLTAMGISEIRDNSTGNKFANDIFLRFQSGKVGDYYMFFDKSGQKPLARNYFYAQDTIQLKSLADNGQKFQVYRYKYEFDPAMSPMATAPRQVSKQLFVDSSFTVTSGTPIILKQEALYYFTRDTTESYGIGIIAVDNRYPKITRPEKLVKPLVYMSTNTEATDLYNTKEAKKSMDNYWLNLMNGNQGAAKRTIKNFYQRVEKANRLFTTYKEGWKTDKGMVWIIMGDPTKITRTKDREVWSYTRNGQFSEINFTFNKRANQFVEDHYELQRYAEYQSIWFPVVEQWRNGDLLSKQN